MCDPFTIAIGTAIAGTVMTTYGSYTQSQAAKSQSEYQAAVAENNRTIAEWQADDALERGNIAARQAALKRGRAEADVLLAQVGQGFDPSVGSNLGLMDDVTTAGKLDELNITRNAELQAHDARVRAMGFDASAGLYQSRADAQNPLLEGATAFAEGASNVAGMWYKHDQGLKKKGQGLKKKDE